MSKNTYIAVILLLTVLYCIPAHAMLARLSQATMRSNAFTTTQQVTPLTGSQPLLQPYMRLAQPTLLARTLATQQYEQTYEYDSEQSDSEQNKKNHTMWGFGLLGGAAIAAYTNQDSFEPKVARADTGQNIALTLGVAAMAGTGAYLWHRYKTEIEKTERKRIIEEIITMILNSPATQTVQHVKAGTKLAIWNLENCLPKKPQDCRAFKVLIEKIISIEHKEQLSGNYTFIHCCPWSLHFYQDINAHLRTAVLDLPTTPLSLRFFKNPNYAKSDKYGISRKELLENGTPNGYFDDRHSIQKKIIFMNATLFANDFFSGSNALAYLANHETRNVPQSEILKKIFCRLDKDKYLQKYSCELKELEDLHNKANQFGAAIIFSFSPKLLNKSVYISRPFGRKPYCSGERQSTQSMIDTLRTKPNMIDHYGNQLAEYVFIVTKDCGLNPNVQESGDLKIIPVNIADPATYALYEQKRDELMAKIKADIDAERAAWNEQEKLAHETTLLEMDEWYKKYNCLNGCSQPTRVQEAE